MKDIFVMLISASSSTAHKLGSDDLLQYVEGRLTALDGLITKTGGLATANAFQGILVLPEYFFCAQDSAGKRKPLTVTEKRMIRQKLLGLSAGHKQILLCPGTIFYEEEIKTQEDRNRAKSNLLAAEFLARKEEKDTGEAQPHRYEGFTTGGGAKVPSLFSLMGAVDKTVTTGAKRVRNVTYLMLAGELAASYDKHSDFSEAMGASPDKFFFVPGTNEQCPVVGGFRFGVEICFDHANGILKRRGVADIDFHLVVSDWAQTSKAKMAMQDGGYFLHASTNPQETQFWRRDGVQYKRLVKPPVKHGAYALKLPVREG